jgi:hypothetical protein
MNLSELEATHYEYKKNLSEWLKYKAAYAGTNDLVEYGALPRNTRESEKSWIARKENAYGFNYTARIVELLNAYIFQKPSNNDYGELGSDDFFQLFLDDSDLCGHSFERTINDLQLWASVFGHVGILIDKPQIDGADAVRTIAQDKADNTYPFITSFTPLNILDWKSGRVNGRPVLSYLKLRDDDNNYRVWTRKSFEVWGIDGKTKTPILLSSGANALGEIPFIFMYNKTSGCKYIGQSDVKEISRIDIAILRLLSGSDEVFSLASFPMLMKPYLPPGVKDENIIGAANVIEFDPKNPDSKPEWLRTEIAEPINAVMMWINNLITEMYKSVHAGGLNANGQVKSGESLAREFQTLNAFLAKKTKLSIINTEESVLYFWLKWQGQDELYEGVTIDRPLQFDISALVDELDNFAVAKTLVNSPTFDKALQKVIARKVLANSTAIDEVTINDEIDAGAVAFDSGDGADVNVDINNDTA